MAVKDTPGVRDVVTWRDVWLAMLNLVIPQNVLVAKAIPDASVYVAVPLVAENVGIIIFTEGSGKDSATLAS